MNHTPNSVRRVNGRLIALVLGTLIGLVALGAILLVVQRSVSRRNLLAQARQLHEKNEDDLAYSYLKSYIEQDPGNVEVLNLAGEILGGRKRSVADWRRAVWMYEQILRSDSDPKSETSQSARRELIRLHLGLGPLLPRMHKQYETARVLANQLLANGATDVTSLRLAASIKLHMADLGDRSELEEATGLLEKVHAQQPEDVQSTLALATLYRDEQEDISKATDLMDHLLEKNRSGQTHLARAQFLKDTAKLLSSRGQIAQAQKLRDQSQSEIQKAVELEPKSYRVCVSAAEAALQNGEHAQAREHLKRLSQEDREKPKVRMMFGLCDLQEEEIDSAVETWRQGLLMSEGTDVELTWWLAYIEFQRNHLAEGRELAEQYRRLVGGEETPSGYYFLSAQDSLAQNRPSEAILKLQKATVNASPDLAAQIYLALANCYGQVRDEASARDAFEEAIRLNPRLTEARLGLARTVNTLHPIEAQHEIKQALETVGDDPGLLVELGRCLISEQLKVPVIRRSWSQVEELVGRAVASAPDDPRTIVFQAEMMMLNGEADKALDLMKAALDREPTQALFWEAYAQTLVDTGRIDEAVSLLQKATSQDPTSDRVKLRIMYARLLDALGRTAEAHSVLTRDLDRLPMGDRAMLWLTLGDLYLIRGNLQDARKAFVQGSKLLPDDPMPLLHLLDMSLNEESGNPIERDGTIRESLEELSRISDESGPYYGLGRAMVLLETASRQTGSVRDQKLDEAKKLIDRARSKFPKERYPHILEGRYQSLVGKPEEAILAYEQAMNCVGGEIVEPQLRALYEELGRRADLVRLRRRHSQQPPSLDRFAAESYIRQGEPGKASEQAASIVERDPDNLEVRVWQSRLLKSIGRTDEAEKTLRELVEREPNQIGPRIALLYFLVGMQKHEEARKLIETIEEMPNLSRPEFVLARCWSITGEIDRAKSAFENSLSRWPDDPGVLIESVRFFDSHDENARAQDILRAFVSKHSDQRWASRALAMLLSGRRGDITAWREAWDLCKPEPTHEDEPDDLLARAIVLSRSPEGDRREEAAGLLEQLLLRLPSDLPSASQARRLLIALHLQLGQPAQAAKVAGVEASQQTGPETLRLYVETLVAAGSLSEAERQLSLLEKLQKGSPTNVLLRARLLAEQKQPIQAAWLLEPQARLWIEDEQSPEESRGYARDAVRSLVSMDQLDAAERLAWKLAEEFPQDRSLVGMVLTRQNRPEEAVRILLESIPTARPEADPEIVRNLVYACRQRPNDLRNIEQAIQGVNLILARNRKDPELRVGQAALYHLKKAYAQEVALYQEALRLNPVDRSFLNNLAWVLSEELNRPAEGLQFVNQALIAAKKARPDILDTRGVIYIRLNRTEEAIHDLERATDALPNPLLFAHLARAYYHAGQTDRYRTARERALKAGLTPEMLQPSELRELGPLLFENRGAS